MNQGRRVGLLAGVAAAVVLVVCLGLSGEVRVHYHLYRLRSRPAELEETMNRPDGTAEREAARRFVATAPGREQLLTLLLDSLSESWNQRRGTLGRRRTAGNRITTIRNGGSGTVSRISQGSSGGPQLEAVGFALLGVRYRASKDEWSVWADLRSYSGVHWGTMAIFRPPFTSGEALADTMRAFCASAKADEPITLPGYPRLRFRVLPFEEGLKSYDATLNPRGHSIERTSFWFETLRSWPELMKAEALLPWVVQVEGVQP